MRRIMPKRCAAPATPPLRCKGDRQQPPRPQRRANPATDRSTFMSDITRRGFLKGAAVAPLVLKPLAAIGQQGPRAESFDIVVAGAGHNSLVTAAYLAKAGYRCVVLEGRPTIGGGVKTAELTLRGFQDDVCSTAQYFIQSNPMLRNNEIPLRDYGLEYIDPDPIFHMAFLDGSHLTQWRDVERTIAEFAKFSKKD